MNEVYLNLACRTLVGQLFFTRAGSSRNFATEAGRFPGPGNDCRPAGNNINVAAQSREPNIFYIMKKIIRKAIAFTVILSALPVTAVADLGPRTLKVDEPRAEVSNTVGISLNVTPPEGAILSNIYMYRMEDQTFRGTCDISSDISVFLEPGHYCFCFKASNWVTMDDYFFVSPWMEVLQDSYFDMNECTNHVKIATYLPDGTEATPETWDVSGYRKVDEGNGYGNLLVRIMRDNTVLTVDASEIRMVRQESGDGGYLGQGNHFWINSLDDDLEIGLLRDFTIWDSREKVVVYNAINASSLSSITEIANDPGKFKCIEGECGDISDESIRTDAPYPFYSVFVANEKNVTDLMGYGCTMEQASPKIWVCTGVNTGTDSELVVNYGKAIAYERLESGSPIFYPIYSFPMTFDDNGVHLNAYISDRMMGENELMLPEGGVDFFLKKPLSSHPRFSWVTKDGSLPKFGNSIPVLVTGNMWESGFRYSMMHMFYLGRYGENRESDLHSGWAEVTVNGENVFQGDIWNLIEWTHTEFGLPKASGEYEFVIDNDCAMVDEREGLNHTVIRCDASAEDHEAPTLTMLNFRNREDVVTDRFDNPDDCIMEFSAADMSSEINEAELDWFSISKPTKVKVEYSADENDNFRALPYEEVPELFYAPCFGAFYRVSFADADMRSATGWFKVRITLEDVTGNIQQQTITPAVYIDALASVTDVVDDRVISRDKDLFRAEGMIMLYDASGRLVKSGNGELSVTGLRGAYIVKNAGMSVKVIL